MLEKLINIIGQTNFDFSIWLSARAATAYIEESKLDSIEI